MPRPRFVLAPFAALLLAALPAAALAHAEVVSSQPAADEVLDTPPSSVVVTFDSELDPDTSEIVVADADGTIVGEGGVDLDVADRNVLRAAASMTGDGEYHVTWSAGSIDGHVGSGEFAFRVGPEPTAGVANTALPVPGSGTAAVGALLLLVALALAVRELRRASR
ncbi:MAG TPA: copper resistance CopC family protein [Candidatus Limnocylindria bacterium]|nr:copper resistance CopC family protein [Candidatus Limnocylindria bacterium]